MSITVNKTVRAINISSPLQQLTVNRVVNTINISNKYPLNPTVDSIVFNTAHSIIPSSVGTLYYDEHDRTLSMVLRNSTLQIGQEIYITCLNKTGAIIPNGSVVYINGAQGNRPTIALASTSTYNIARATIGMATHDIDNNQEGTLTTFGLVRDLNTNAYHDGYSIYVGSTPGSFTETEPAVGLARIRLGRIIKSHASDGWVGINISNDKYMFGDRDNNNYSIFEDSGFIKYVGNARPYVDIDFPVIIRNTGTGIPSLATFQGNLRAPQWTVNDYYDADDQELIHQWDEGTSAMWHAHIWTGAQDATDRYIRLQIEFTAANFYGNGNTNTQAIENITQNSGDFLIPANTPIRTHFVVPIYTWVPTGFLIGAHVKARLTRIASSGIAPSSNFFCGKFQMHVRCDTGGSRDVTAK